MITEENKFYLCGGCQTSYHIDSLAHFDANFYCSKCLRQRFFTYYHKIPINSIDELLAQVFGLIYTDKSFKEQLKELLAKFGGIINE